MEPTPQLIAGGSAPVTGSKPPAAKTPSKMSADEGSMPSDSTASDSKPSLPPATEPKPSADGSMDPMQDPSAGGAYPDLRGQCTIKSEFAGDDVCISAPGPEEGMQLHVGPSDYDDPAEVEPFLMQPGEERTECWTFQTPNEEDIWYQSSVFSGRAGTHHIINQMYTPGAAPNGGFRQCGASGTTPIGSIPGASKAYMARTHVAPEYADVGRKIPAKSTIQSDMHYFNFTDKTILREYWLNIYFAPKDAIQREARAIRGLGGVNWLRDPIAPGTDMVYKYACPIKGDGHILNILGHYHAHGKRFTASILRKSGTVDKVFEMFDYVEPAVFEYNTLVTNPSFQEGTSGAVSGRLAVSDGDTMQWECHIINDSQVGLRYTNEVNTGEMCNLWGSTLGIDPIACPQR